MIVYIADYVKLFFNLQRSFSPVLCASEDVVTELLTIDEFESTKLVGHYITLVITLVITNETLNVLIGSDTFHQKFFDLNDKLVENHQVSIHTTFCNVTLFTNATIDVYFELFSFFISRIFNKLAKNTCSTK